MIVERLFAGWQCTKDRRLETMGKAKKTRKFAAVKRMISPRDTRINSVRKAVAKAEEKKRKQAEPKQIDQIPSNMFFKYNAALGPPYNVIVDTNFINFSIKNKLEVVSAMMDCLLAKCTPCITDCVMAELEKLGHKYRVALRLAKDPRFERLPCTHKGTYADDCLVQRVQQHRCYVVATCDRELKRRIRKVPGVPIMYISNRKYVIERLPEANAAKIK
ncbi:rRNA-processing protein FCF1 [Phytophthora citrophthora]|uniref:rRNA-processing protein FCF1 n=1 Tax=Phytophthora citrophthora TaxID=4793 RepID=A0AAD9G347_9STRA|nr:rRNA-processing protein FCF1 [Phytophthora citrophthora]